MLWQDYVFTIGGIIFILALIPSITGKDKPALTSSLSTGIVLVIYAVTYITLSLWYSALTISLTALCWFILAFQKYRQVNNQK
jgi:hypothetical protein